MHRLVHFLDCVTDIIGKAISFLLLFMMLVTCLVVVLRYLFNSGEIIFLQQVVSYLHATTFLLAAGWTLKRNGHVRVDIFYRKMSARRKAWVDSLGILIFLMPFCVFLFMTSMDFVGRSWSIKETSVDAGGIPYVYLLKTLIPGMAVLLFLQGTAELLRNGLFLCVNVPTQKSEGEYS